MNLNNTLYNYSFFSSYKKRKASFDFPYANLKTKDASNGRAYIWGIPLFLIALLVINLSVTAQNTVDGVVRDKITNETVPGVVVNIKNTTEAVITDSAGKFKLSTNQKFPFTLVFNFVSYEEQSIDIYEEPEGPLEVKLKSTNVMNSVVVVGYGTQKRKDIVGSVSTIDAATTKDIPVASLDAQLQGKAAGVQINSQSGVPGEGIEIRVRGSTSINASVAPLYIIDGVYVNDNTLSGGSTSGNVTSASASGNGVAGPVNLGEKSTSPLADISPDDIESIVVLKDAEATAIYGSRGANGVVIVTTKHGDYGTKSQILFNTSFGVAAEDPYRMWKVATGEQYAQIVNETWINSGIDDPALHQTAANEPFQNAPNGTWYPGNATYRGTPAEQQSYTPTRMSEAFRTAGLSDYSLGFQGGNNTSNYYIGGSYTDQEAVLQGDNFQRWAVKINLTQKLNKNVTIGVNNSISYTFRNQVRDGNGPDAGILQSALQTPTYLPTNSPSGAPLRWANFDNTQVLEDNPSQWTASLRYIGNFYLDADLLPGLKFHSSTGIDYDDYHEYEYYDEETQIGSEFNGEAKSNLIENSDFVNEQTLTYTKTFSQKNNFSFLIGNTLMSNFYSENDLAGTDFPSDQYTEISNAVNQNAAQSQSQNTLASFFARATYNYDEKYYLEATIRADGSSKFGADNRWGYFPSAGAAWRINKEAFLKNVKTITDLKLRGSFGITGNQNGINDFASQGLWSGGSGYPNSPTSGDQPGTAPQQLANPNLKWEETQQSDIGVDIGLLKDRIEITADVYDKLTTNALIEVPVPASTGYAEQLQNAAKISNKGYEFSITTTNIRTKDFKWTTDFNISGNTNDIEQLNVPITFYSRNWLIDQQGSPMYSFWLYKQLYVDPKTGNAVFQTANGGTSYSSTYSPNITLTTADRKVMGNAMPKFFGGITNGFSYKAFDVSVFFSYEYGNELINYNEFLGEKQGQPSSGFAGRFIIADQLNAWTTPGQITDVPRVTSVGNNYLIEENSRFLQDGSFIRLKTLTIGYTLPTKLTSKVRIKKLRVYFEGTNLLLFTKYNGPDPEINVGNDQNVPGLDQGTPPQPRVFQIGANVTL